MRLSSGNDAHPVVGTPVAWGAIVNHFPQFPLFPIRDIAALKETAAQETGDPLRILDVRLATGHILPVLGIGHENLHV